VVRHLTRWDFLLSLGFSAAFLIFVFSSDRPLSEANVPVTAAIPFGVALAVAATVAGNRLADGTKDDTYGEVLRSLDPKGAGTQRPYLIISVVGVACAALGSILLVTGDELSRSIAAWAYAVEVFLASYALFGFLDLLLLGSRHHSRQSQLRALRERENRRKS
jgi:hypothetical protein